MSDYALAQNAQYAGNSAANYAPPSPPSPLSEMANVSRKQAQDIRDITAQLSALADRLFGAKPQPLNAPATQMHGSAGISSQIDPPLVPAAEQTQFMVGEAIETLRRVVLRIDRL